MYQALYRKWRPKTFSDVVGQAHITETLRRQVAQGRLSHAYLFTGTRGTGKTTCAKILAKAVNCEHPIDGDPCNACAACLGIDNGSLLDVLELDAASNNGVDHVRALRDEAIYSPARVTYRVYIVDEVHMLSTAAFNALLKILEEPPAHLIFILATTELHKVPATILSRCQRFAFKRIQPTEIGGRLQFVAREEGMTLETAAAQLLARLADGALRDALSLLDQCAAAGGIIDTARVLEVLGLAGTVQTAQLMECILRRDVPNALWQLDRLYSGGKDVSALLGELSSLARDMLIHITAPEGGAALLSGAYDTAMMDTLTRGVTPARLIYMTGQLQSVIAALPLSGNRRTDAELCLMRLCDESLCSDITALNARVARLEEGGITVAPAAVPVPSGLSPRPVPAGQTPPPVDDADALPPPGVAVVQETTPETPAVSPVCRKDTDIWGTLIEKFKDQVSPMYQYMLDDARGELEGDLLVVRCGDDLTRDTLDCPPVLTALSSVASQHLGRQIGVRLTLAEKKVSPPGEDRLETLIRAGDKYENFIVT